MVDVDLLVAGHCAQLERFTRAGGAWRPIEFPSLVAVIRHATEGVLLFDTGYAPRFATAAARWPYRLYASLLPVTCTPQDAALTQLADRSIAPGAVRMIVLSHLHGDHVSGLRDFPDARILLGTGALPDDWRDRSAWSNAVHGFVPALLPDDVAQRVRYPDPDSVVCTGLGGMLDRGHDRFGDGSVVTVPLPGHTRGHQGVWLPTVGPDGLLLVGDACWTERAYTHGDLPAGFILRSGDERDYRAVVADLARLHRERAHLLIVPSHCRPSISRAQAVLGG